jgi:hypothetical protein
MNSETDQPIQVKGTLRPIFYLLPIAICPLLMFLAAFLVVPTQWFNQRSNNSYLANIGYGNKLHDTNCQILVFGDSTAMVGISPILLEKRTGLTACNIAEFAGMTQLLKTEIVDQFLQQNPTPRFIVFMYAPEYLNDDPRGKTRVSMFEAVSFSLEYEHNFNTMRVLATHPMMTIGWAEQGIRMAILRFFSRPFPSEVAHLRERYHGQLPVEAESRTVCTPPDKTAVMPEKKWAEDLRTRYQTAKTQVIVDATPLASCDASLPFLQQELVGTVDNIPYRPIPITSYLAFGRLHVNKTGASEISNMIADQIIERLHPKAGKEEGGY